MKLDESNEFQNEMERETRKKTLVLISIVFCGILAALLFMLIIVIQKEDAVTLKMFLNDKQFSIPSGFMIEENGVRYFDIQQLGDMLNYTYQKGEYQKFNENVESCSLQNAYEIIAVTANKEFYTKYTNAESEVSIGGFEEIVFENPNGYSENFYVENPIILKDETLYVSETVIPKMFNIAINFSNQYRLKFYDFDTVIISAKERLAKSKTYDEISGSFENMKAIVDGYIVVRSNGLSGIIKTSDFNNPILGIKYKNIKYIQSLNKFYVVTDKDLVGLVDSEGNQVVNVENEYNDISIFDQNKELYLVKKNKQYGIVDKYGQEVIVPEYDQLGIDITKFTSDNLENGNIIYDECIPFLKENDNGDSKYGLLNIHGDVILSNYYDDLGFKSTNNSTSNTRERSILIIPESEGIRGIVVMQNDHYGIYNVDTKSLATPVAFNKIYVRTLDGVTNYYMEDSAKNTLLLRDYFIQAGIIGGNEYRQKTEEPTLNDEEQNNF